MAKTQQKQNDVRKSGTFFQPLDQNDDPEEQIIQSESDLQIIVDRVRAVTIKALLTVQGIQAKAIVDTGAEVTVLSERLYNIFPDNMKPKLQKAKRGLVVAEAGREMKTCGVIDVEFKIGEKHFIWPVYVAPIRDEILLGCDLIHEMDITLNTKRGLQVGEEWVECEVIRSHDSTAEVKVARAVTKPAQSEFIMRGRCNSVLEDENMTYLFEATDEAKDVVMIARSVTKPVSNKIPVKMMNHSSAPIRLKKGFILGTLQSVGSLMQIGTMSDISEEGMGICRLRCHEDGHQRIVQDSHSTTRRKLESFEKQLSIINEIQEEFSAEESKEEKRDKITPQNVPSHLQDLYENSVSSLNQQQKVKLADLLVKYQDAFAKTKTELGKCSVLKHRIDTAKAAPVRQPLRRTPQGFEGEEEKYLQEQLASGAIQPSSSAWSSPLVLVRKKKGDVRVCIDYRKLNERTVKDAYPLPRIDMCLDCLASSKIYSTIDLQSAYMQLELAEEDRHKTAFITKHGLYEYSVMPFGLCNAPSTFQRCMELIMRGLQWNILLVYLDDIIVIASNFDEHIERLDEVFSRLLKAGLKMKPSKCELFKTEVLF